MKVDGTLDGREDSMATPSPLPLLPDEGRGFLDGSIETDVYLRHKRAQARAKAISEIERERPFRRAGLFAGTVGLLVVLGNLGLGIASFSAGDQQIGILAIVTAIVVAVVTALLVATTPYRPRS